MTAPVGRNIGRLHIRVLPDTTGFRRDLRQFLDSIDEDVEIGLDLVADNFRGEVTRAVQAAEAGQKVSIPIEMDRSLLDRLDDVVPDSRPVDIPVRPDRNDRDWDFTPKPVDVPLRPDRDERDWDFQPPPIDVPVNVDRDKFDRDTRNLDLDPVQVDLLPNFNPQGREWAPAIEGIDIPVRVDQEGLSREVRKARADALKVLSDGNLLLKLDADDDVLRRKLQSARQELERFNEFGRDILLDADATPVLNKIRQVEQRLETLDLQKSSPSVDLRKERAEAELAELQRRLEFFENKNYDVEVQAETERARANVRRFEQQLAALTAKRQKIEVDIDTDRVGRALGVLRGDFDSLGTSLENSIGGATRRSKTLILDMNNEIGKTGATADKSRGQILGLTGAMIKGFGMAGKVALGSLKGIALILTQQYDQLFRSIESGFSNVAGAGGEAMSSVRGQVGAMLNLTLQLARAVVGVATALYQVGAVATVIELAGAGVTAAWGGLSTVIAAINPALALVAVAAGTVWLGFDGIKKAAGTLIPELGRLKAAASETFEKGMTPAFERLRSVIPTVEAGVRNVATAISSGADQLSNWIVQIDEIGRLETIFNNVTNALQTLNPRIVSIVDSMSKVMELESGFKALTGAVDQFATSFHAGVTETIGDGSLNRAFEGLEGTLRALARGFAELVTNGIQVFAGAAPGVNSLLNSMSDFFGRFDWERLGKAVGNVFDGLATAIDNVPTETIEGITRAFEEIGEKFQDPAIQDSITKIIEALPTLIGLMEDLGGFFLTASGHIADFVTWLDDAWDSLKKWDDEVTDWFKDLFDDSDQPTAEDLNIQSGGITWDGLVSSFKELDKAVTEFFGGLPEYFSGVWETISTNATEAWNGLTAELSGIWETVTETARGAWEGLGEFFSGLWTNITEVATTAWTGLTEFLSGIWTNITEIARTAWTGLQEFFSTLWTNITEIATTAWTGLMEFLTGLWTNIVEIARTAWTGLQEFFTTLWTNIREVATTAWNGLLEFLTGIWTNITEVARTAWTGLQEFFATLWTNITEVATTAWNGLVEFLTGIWTNVVEVARTAWTGLQEFFTTLWTTITETARTAWTGFTEFLTTTWQGIVETGRGIWEGFTEFFATTWETIRTGATTAWETIKTTISNALETIRTTVTEALETVKTRAQEAWETIKTSASEAWENIKTTVSEAVEEVRRVVEEKFNEVVTFIEGVPDAILEALGDLGSLLVEAGKSLMDGLLQGIKDAADGVYEYVSGIAGKIKALKGPLPYDRKLLIPAGQAIMDGLQKGLAAGFDVVTRDLLSYTKHFANLEFDSPGMEQWESGLDNAAMAASSYSGSWQTTVEDSEFNSVSDAIAAELAKWGIQIDPNGLAKMVNKSNTRKARR